MTLLIFDCDGVLVDSEQIAITTLRELMSELGHSMTMEEGVRAFAGRSLADVRLTAEKMLGRPIPEERGEYYGRKMTARFRHELQPMAGIKEAIAALPYRRCVASSSTLDRLILSLEVTGLAPLFRSHVFSGAQVAHGKPAPDLFLFAARSMGEALSNCIVIEDTILGVEAGRAAGMAVIGFAGASHATDEVAAGLAAAGADPVIRSMADLPSNVELLVGR